MKTCPECCADMPDAAAVCHACGRRVVGKACPDCAELSKAAAKKCRYCGHDFGRDEKVMDIKPFSAKAAMWPTVLRRGRWIPQEIHLSTTKIVIQTWGAFWLSRTDEDIPWEKVAGYHYHSGLLWDSLEIQTRGQKSNRIAGLSKSSGRKIKEMLEQMKA